MVTGNWDAHRTQRFWRGLVAFAATFWVLSALLVVRVASDPIFSDFAPNAVIYPLIKSHFRGILAAYAVLGFLALRFDRTYPRCGGLVTSVWLLLLLCFVGVIAHYFLHALS